MLSLLAFATPWLGSPRPYYANEKTDPNGVALYLVAGARLPNYVQTGIQQFSLVARRPLLPYAAFVYANVCLTH